MILKHRDKELLRFEWIEPQGVRIVSVNEANRRFLPLEFKGNALRVKPALYSNWLGFPGDVTKSMLERMRTLKGFRFKRHKYYNLPKDRLCAIENFLQKRILQIEEYGKKADDIFKVFGKSGTVNPVNGESLALQIIANLKADPFVSYDELSELMGVPRRTVARRIKELSAAGKIRRMGASKNGYWEVL